MESEARCIRDIIGRDLTWLERQRFNMKLGGWRWWAITAGYLPRMILAIPLFQVLLLYWIGQLLERAMTQAERGLMWLGDFTKVERLPWHRADGESWDLWAIPRVTRALLEMGLINEEQIDAHQPKSD